MRVITPDALICSGRTSEYHTCEWNPGIGFSVSVGQLRIGRDRTFLIHSLISAIGQIIVPYAWRRLPASYNLVEWPLNKLLRYCRVGTTIIIVVANLLLFKQRRRLVRRCDASRRSSNSSILRRSNWGVTVIQWNNSRNQKHQSWSSRWIPNIHKSNSPAYT